jgi:hypothetical protein
MKEEKKKHACATMKMGKETHTHKKKADRLNGKFKPATLC